MKVTFEDIELEKLVLMHQSKKYKEYQRDSNFLSALDRVYFTMQEAPDANSLHFFSFLHYEQLRNVGMSSVRVMNGRV